MHEPSSHRRMYVTNSVPSKQNAQTDQERRREWWRRRSSCSSRVTSAMAHTALGMATTLVGSALRVASSAAREEMGLLLGVHDDIWYFLYYFFFLLRSTSKLKHTRTMQQKSYTYIPSKKNPIRIALQQNPIYVQIGLLSSTHIRVSGS